MKVLLATLVFIIPQIVTARILETHKGCVERYGEEIIDKRFEREIGDGKFIISYFSFKGFKITASFYQDMCVLMIYHKEDGSDITISEVEYLNNANWRGKWQRLKRKDFDHNKKPFWSAIMDKDSDIGLTAYLRDRRQLEYKTDIWTNIREGTEEGRTEQKLKGF